MSNDSDDDSSNDYKPTRRQLLRGVGVAGATGTAALANSTFNITDRVARYLGLAPTYAEEEEVDERAEKAGEEAAREELDKEFKTENYLDISDEDFEQAYDFVRDELEAEKYGLSSGETLHDAILNEDPHYRSMTNDNLEDGELKGVDLRYAESEAVDSQIRFDVQWGRDGDITRNSVIKEDLEDEAAEAMRDALYEVLDENKIENEYGGDKW